jgi:hypothetical protein
MFVCAAVATVFAARVDDLFGSNVKIMDFLPETLSQFTPKSPNIPSNYLKQVSSGSTKKHSHTRLVIIHI